MTCSLQSEREGEVRVQDGGAGLESRQQADGVGERLQRSTERGERGGEDSPLLEPTQPEAKGETAEDGFVS